jgi:hypothetical protein
MILFDGRIGLWAWGTGPWVAVQRKKIPLSRMMRTSYAQQQQNQ